MTKLKQLDKFKFNIEFDEKNLSNLIVDEIEPIGESSGPNPHRLLSAAIGHCLSSSLVFCLSKARVKLKGLETVVTTDIQRNEEGYQRVKKIDVQINVEASEDDKKRVPKCLKIFENYCTVTQSVRKGIQVNVKVT